jgi:fatty acid elongase 3
MASTPATLLESFPIPSLDRPFGVRLWPHFSQAFELATGYPADSFAFVVGKTPMSTLKETSIFVAVYYTVIFGGRELMRHREPLKLKPLFLVHNLFLTTVSAVLLALYIEELVPTLARKGVFHAICDADGGWTQHLVLLYYVG